MKRGVIDMDNPADNLDQADEDILTNTVSDEALEAAAGTEMAPLTYVTAFCGCSWNQRCT